MLLKFRVLTEWLEMIYYFPNSEKKKKGRKTHEDKKKKQENELKINSKNESP